jgi:nitrite reductase/ring-hydroxylating ferredoxin subunit
MRDTADGRLEAAGNVYKAEAAERTAAGEGGLLSMAMRRDTRDSLPDYVCVARVSDVPPGAVAMVRAGERWYALANVDGAFHAVDNNCPHNGGPLGKGRLRGSELECPWHQWRWDVTSGRACWPSTQWRVLRVPVRLVGDEVLLPVL